MSRRIRCLLTWIAVGAWAGTVTGRTEEPLPARVWLNKELSWDVDLLGRFGKNRIAVRKKGEEGELNLPPERILRIDFSVSTDRNRILDLYLDEKFDQIRDLLARELTPLLPYADVPSNVGWFHNMYMRSLYWTGRHQELARIATQFEDLTTPEIRYQARLWRTLALIATEALDEAAEVFDTIPSAESGLRYTAPYHYTRARLHEAAGRTGEAREAIASVIAFHTKDFEWMPAALCLSAQWYAEAGNTQVARQITDEIRTAYPATRWSAQAEMLADSLAAE